MEISEMHAVQVANLPGVKDLPIKARVKFAKALIAESKGNTAEAESLLGEAIALELEFPH